MSGEGESRLQLVNRRLVIRVHVVHGANDGQVIDMPGNVGHQFRHWCSTGAVAVELPGARHQSAGSQLNRTLRQLRRNRSSCVALQLRLGIEGVHLTGATLHAQVDDGGGARQEMGVPRAQVERLMGRGMWVDGLVPGQQPAPVEEVPAEEKCQGGSVDAIAHVREEPTAARGSQRSGWLILRSSHGTVLPQSI